MLLQALATLVMLVATPLAYAVSVTIPLLMRADDPRLDSRRLERAYLGQATGSVADGFQLGLDDAGFELEASKLQVKLVVIAVGSLDDAKAAAIKLTQGSAAVIVADLPAPWLIAVSTASNIPVVNVGESADSLRQADLREAGITGYKYIDWFRDHPVEDDLKLLKWTDETHKGKGYVDWYSYDHPELGKVELGGWNRVYTFRDRKSVV